MAVVPCVQALRSVWLQPAQRQQVCDRHVGSGTARWHRHLRCTASADHAEGAAETSGSSSAIHKPAARHWQRVEGSATASGTASGGTLDRQIRRASTSDLEQLCILEQLTAEEGSTWSCRQVEAELTRERATVLVVDAGSVPVAWAVGWDVSGELHILNVACHPNHRRQGHARALLTKLVEMHSKAEVAQLEVRVSNEAALQLYASLGFERVGKRKNYYPSGEDAVLMNLVLQPHTQ